MSIDLTKVQGDASAILNIRVNFSSAPENKIRANAVVERNTYNMSSNPQSEGATENYSYQGTPEEVKAAMDADLGIGSYLLTSTGV